MRRLDCVCRPGIESKSTRRSISVDFERFLSVNRLDVKRRVARDRCCQSGHDDTGASIDRPGLHVVGKSASKTNISSDRNVTVT